MSIPYRTQQGMKRLAVVLLVLVLVAALVWLCWLLWLNRFVVYTQDGAVFDMEQATSAAVPEVAIPPVAAETVPIYFNEHEDEVETVTEVAQLIGYYIDSITLQGDVDTIKKQLQQLPVNTPVMIEVKDSFGAFAYNTSLNAPVAENIDAGKVDELITYMNNLGLYTIARVAALRDYTYGLNNVNDGLPTSGGWLWADGDYRYWLNPGREGVQSYLGAIAKEVKSLGFDEVVFTDFRFPDSDGYVYSGDKAAALSAAAQNLADSYASARFKVSFEGSEGLVYPGKNSRIYVTDATALEAEAIATTLDVPDPTINLVFVTNLYDTRFDVYGVLRPLSYAVAE